jgi:Zn-finger protein
MITQYDSYCLICAKPKDDIHHCLKGHKQRHLADEDGLMIPLCRECHEQVHKKKELNILVEIIGQLAWEREYLINRQILPFDDSHDEISDEAREAFRTRYGRSYL